MTLCALTPAALIAATPSPPPTPAPYTWDTVPIGGCGYVTGIVANRHGDIYLRSDMGGVMRWDDTRKRWINLSDGFGSHQHSPYSIESIALDYTNRDIIYTAVGWKGEATSDVLRSADRGRTWTTTGWKRAHGGVYGNADYRWSGERLAVDPNKPTILYYGTRENGLWKNTDPANPAGHWTQIPKTTLPPGGGAAEKNTSSTKIGISFVAFDQTGGTDATGATTTIYAGVYASGVYRTTDAGATWKLMPGSPRYPIRGTVSPLNGTLYITEEYDAYKQGGAYYCPRDGAFAKSRGLIQPAGYSGLALHPTDPNIILVARHDRGRNNEIFRSTDAGKTFTEIKKQKNQTDPAWWPDGYFFARTCGLLIDPLNPKRVFAINWFGEWMTNNINAPTPVWQPAVAGHEGSNPRCLYSPPAGEARLFIGIGDSSGFRWTDTAKYPERQIHMNTTDINAYVQSPGNPNLLYCVGCNRSAKKGALFKSTDNGKTWKTHDPAKIPTLPKTYYGGRLALSATDPNNLVWLSIGDQVPHYTKDGGATWAPCKGLETENTIGNSYLTMRQPLTSNITGKGGYFYLLTIGKKNLRFFRSADGGATFEHLPDNGLPNAKTPDWIIKGVPNQDGGIWAALGDTGLYKSTNYGAKFTKIPQVASLIALGFGKSKPDSAHPATAYIIGKLKTDTQPENRVYRTDDMGETWTRINDDAHKFGLANCIEGDGRDPGKVYIGTGGRGVFYGVEKPDFQAGGSAD